MKKQHLQPESGHYFQRLVTRITSASRLARLRHQLAEIEPRALELPHSYREQLVGLIQRELAIIEANGLAGHGDQTDAGTTTSGIEVGYDRARSDNVQVRMRGLALWLALVYHATRGDNAADVLHRQVLRLLRELKAFAARPPANSDGN